MFFMTCFVAILFLTICHWVHFMFRHACRCCPSFRRCYCLIKGLVRERKLFLPIFLGGCVLLYLGIHTDSVVKLHHTCTVIHFAHRVTCNITQAGTELSFHLLFHLFCLQSLHNRFQLNDFCSQNFIYLC